MNIWKKQVDAISLLDDDFLATLLEQGEREIYARIASLNMDELPIEYIEGKVTGGSINVDGSSAVRRTCNLTMVAEDVNFHDYYWGLCTKFRLEIGIANKLTGEYSADLGIYPDIVWFPEGVFVITSFNTSLSINSYTISITGKDKMCMLNGEFGGQLFASIDFGQEEYKNKIFNKVDTSGITTSEGLMERQYYYPIEFNENNWNMAEDILETDENYSFTQVGEKICFASTEECVGKYYKQENVYKPVRSTDRYYSAVYALYKLIIDPAEIFDATSLADPNDSEIIEDENTIFWKAESYYCVSNSSNIDNTKYYTLDNAKKYDEHKTYYKLKDIYSLDYEYSIKKIPIEKIIRESVHTYAKEPYSNIVINDLNDYGLEQLTYKGDKPLIAIRDASTQHFVNLAFVDSFAPITETINHQEHAVSGTGGADFYFTVNEDGEVIAGTFSASNNQFLFQFDKLTEKIAVNTATRVYFNNTENVHKYQLEPNNSFKAYTFALINFGDDIGYRVTDLTYPGDLVSSIGESLTSVLDKIKNMLGDFEYFYNLEGQFVFQRKKTYVDTSFSQLTKTDDETYVTYANDKSKFSFNFEGNRLISAVQNTPILSNLRNDIVVWGKRKSITGQDIPIHARYAIDRKPTEYMTFKGIFYYTKEAKSHPSNQYKDFLTGGEAVGSYSKNINIIPQCLIDSDPALEGITGDENRRKRTLWYELKDWADYYYIQTGVYPKQEMLNYSQPIREGEAGGFSGSITFPDEQIYNLSGQLIIDFIQQDRSGVATLNPDAFIPYYNSSPFQHKYYNCGHTYAEFLERYDLYRGMISYVYNPKMPNESVIEADGGELKTNKTKCVDWRELIYQMALDYFAGQGCSEEQPIYDLEGNLVLNNPDHFLSEVAARNRDMYPSGYTGYEQYYTDMQGFWRQLYNPDYLPQPVYDIGYYKTESEKMGNSNFWIKTKNWQKRKVKDISFEYYVPIDSDAASLYRTIASGLNENYQIVDNDAQKLIDSKEQYILSETAADLAWWNINVFNNPESINFWIEFLDEGEELTQFSVKSLGDRIKVVNDDKVTAIIFRDIPDIILHDRFFYGENGERTSPDTNDLRLKIQENTGYTWVYLPKGFSQYLTMSYRSISAKDKIDELLYQHAYCIENISITALPIYHLEPNTRIYVCDKTTNLIGEYIVNRFSLPLVYNGTMSITATLAPQRLY